MAKARGRQGILHRGLDSARLDLTKEPCLPSESGLSDEDPLMPLFLSSNFKTDCPTAETRLFSLSLPTKSPNN
eukprot:3476342-Amphidinium_carterae.1